MTYSRKPAQTYSNKPRSFIPRVGNLSPVADQKQTQQDMAGRTNFPPTIPLPLLLLNLGNLWNFNQINSWFSQFVTKVQNATEHIYSTTRKEGRFIKYNTTRLAIYSYYNLVKGLRAGWFCFAGRRLPTPVFYCVKRNLRKRIWSYSFRHIGHTNTNNGFFKLVEAFLRIHLCFFPRNIKLRGLPLSTVTALLHYLPRCLRSTVTSGKRPATVTCSEPLKIYGHVVVTQWRTTAE